MSELPVAVPPNALLLPVKQKRKVKRDKFVKTIVLFEMKDGARVETKIPATTDAAKVLRAITAEKLRSKLESALDGTREYTAKEYKDFAEALAKLSEIDKQEEAKPAAKPGSLTLNNSVIASGQAGEDVAALLGAVASAATTKKAEPVIDLEKP